jgi:hypothetical protein
MPFLMGFFPILVDPDLHPKRHGQCCGFGHERPDLPTYFLHRCLGYFEDKLIMDLHDKLGVDTALGVPTVYVYHRPLDDTVAVPCIGALMAVRSAYCRRLALRELISGRTKRCDSGEVVTPCGSGAT